MHSVVLASSMLLILAAAGWGGIDNRGRTLGPVWQDVPSDTLIVLFRTNCYGGCTVYTVTIRADGSVVYQGGENAKTQGRIDSRISQEKVKELVAAFNEIDYFSLADRYDHGSKDCPNWGTDAPSAVTSFTLNQKKKTVRHYLGCSGSPVVSKLAALEHKIDEAVNVKQWIE